MARSGKVDPVEKFRFTVTFFDAKFNAQFGEVKVNNDNVVTGGFSEVTLPSVRVNEISYRENIDMNRVTKAPGLVSYEPVVLRRGVTTNKQLYGWYRQVHNDVYNLNAGNEMLASANVVPVHSTSFRKEVMISVMDREGKYVKHWLCFNAFPISYKGGDDLNAKTEEVLIAELSFTYEAFVELTGDTIQKALEDARRESRLAFEAAAKAAAVSAVASGLSGLF